MDEDELTADCIKKLGHSLHWLRAANRERIKDCANALDLTIQDIDELERGNAAYIHLYIVSELTQHYGEKIYISIGEGDAL